MANGNALKYIETKSSFQELIFKLTFWLIAHHKPPAFTRCVIACALSPKSTFQWLCICVLKRMCDDPLHSGTAHDILYLFTFVVKTKTTFYFTRDNLRLRLWYCNATFYHVVYECAMSSRV